MVNVWVATVAVVLTVKRAEVALAGTVTEAGSVTPLPEPLNVTTVSAAGAACDSATVQDVAAFGPSVFAAHCSDDNAVVGTVNAMAAVAALVSSVAVTVADWLDTNEPAVAVNVALVAPAAMITDAGTLRLPELDASVTTAPLPLAAAFRFAVQVDDPPGPSVLGLQAKELNSTEGAAGETVILPPVAETLRGTPAAETPIALLIPMVEFVAFPLSVNVTIATTPFEIAPMPIPDAMQV